MEYVLLNALPIVSATGAGLVLGAAFRASTRRLSDAGISHSGNGAPLTASGWVAIALAEAWLAAILAGALILAPAEAGAWTMALGSAVVIWIGFVVPATIVNHLHRGLGAKAAAVDAVYWLVVMLAQAVVLKSLGLVSPSG